jgi:hypothetical protein
LHYEDGISREQLIELGMIDTENLLVRARVCAACHVGSSENDMNHDMIAAGHPPLRFELASYEALLKPKHWNDRPARLATPNYELQLWSAGRLAAADAALELLASRAAGESTHSLQRPWPELSEANCFACHQALRPRSARTGDDVAADSSAAALGWQTWNLTLLDALLPKGKVAEHTRSIQQAFERSLVPDAKQVSRFALAAQDALRRDVHCSPQGIVLFANDQPVTVAIVIRSIAAPQQADTWDGMCQQLAALAAARRTLADRQATLSLDLEQRLKHVAAALRFSAPAMSNPRYFELDAVEQIALQRELSQVAEAIMHADPAIDRRTQSAEVLP